MPRSRPRRAGETRARCRRGVALGAGLLALVSMLAVGLAPARAQAQGGPPAPAGDASKHAPGHAGGAAPGPENQPGPAPRDASGAGARAPGDAPGDAIDQLPEPPAGRPSTRADHRARRIFLRGDRLFAQGKYEQALVAFAQSYRLSGRPGILLAMANAYERLGHYETALRALQRYAPEAPRREQADVRERIRVLEQRIAEQARPAEPASPAPEDGASDRASDPVAGAPPAGADTSVRADLGAGSDPGPGAPARASRGGRPVAGWFLVGSGTATMGVGVILGLVARDARRSAGDLCREAANGDLLCLPEARDDFARNRSFSLAADITLGAGAAAVLAGAIVLLVAGDDAPASSPVLTIGPGSLEVGIAGHF